MKNWKEKKRGGGNVYNFQPAPYKHNYLFSILLFKDERPCTFSFGTFFTFVALGAIIIQPCIRLILYGTVRKKVEVSVLTGTSSLGVMTYGSINSFGNESFSSNCNKLANSENTLPSITHFVNWFCEEHGKWKILFTYYADVDVEGLHFIQSAKWNCSH